MEALAALHQEAMRDRRLVPLRQHSAELVRRYVEVQEEGGEERLRGFWTALKAARDAVTGLNVTEAIKRSLLGQVLRGKAEMERLGRLKDLARQGSRSADVRFSGLAYLYAQGQPEDRERLPKLPKSGEQAGLRQKVEMVLARREVEQRHKVLLENYHLLMLRVQRGSGNPTDEVQLAAVAAELEQCDDQLNGGASLTVARKIDGLNMVVTELRRIGEELRALRGETGSEGRDE